MALYKDYGLIGVGNQVQLGKQGPNIKRDGGSSGINFTDENGSTAVTVAGANGTLSNHFVTRAQLDAVQITEATFTAILTFNGGNAQLGTIPIGTKTIITTLTVNTVFDGNAVVSVGSSVDNELLMGQSYNSLDTPGAYQTIATITFAEDTPITAFVPSSTATQGNATVVVSYY